MTTPSIADLTTPWAQRSAVTNKLNRAGVRLLADGRSVTAAAFAEATGMAVGDVESTSSSPTAPCPKHHRAPPWSPSSATT